MAYDLDLAERVRGILGGHPALVERKMFGGIAFMLQGNLAAGVAGDELMVRVPRIDHDTLLAMPYVRVMDMTGRPMRGWLLVARDGVVDDDALEEWVDRGSAYALSLPPK